jgi:hypothetical protein
MPLGLGVGMFVDADETCGHKAVSVEAPIFVTVGTKPVTAVVAVFVGKSHCDEVAGEGPQLLDKAIVQLSGPLAGEKCLDFLAPIRKLATVRQRLSSV